MRVSTESLFQGLNGLRRIVDELEDALAASNNEVVRLAARVKALEEELNAVITYGLPAPTRRTPLVPGAQSEEKDDAIQGEGRNEVHQKGNLEDR
jgi:hypothetical protein